MIFRIAVFFGPCFFTADCENVAVAFRNAEAVILSPIYPGTPEEKAEDIAACLLSLADLAERRSVSFQMGPIRVEAIKTRRRA